MHLACSTVNRFGSCLLCNDVTRMHEVNSTKQIPVLLLSYTTLFFWSWVQVARKFVLVFTQHCLLCIKWSIVKRSFPNYIEFKRGTYLVRSAQTSATGHLLSTVGPCPGSLCELPLEGAPWSPGNPAQGARKHRK